jgi:hypothetical protein
LQTSPELVDEAPYSHVSATAVVALVAGLASPVAFVGPLFFLVPAIAIGAGLLALAQIRRGGGSIAGASLAHVAVALAVACAVAALVRGQVRDALMKRQAAAAASDWFDLLGEQHIEDALKLMSGEARSHLVPQPTMGQQPVSEEEALAISRDRLLQDPLTKALATGAKPVLRSVSPPLFDGPKVVVAATFGMPEAGDSSSRVVQVQVVKYPQYEREGRPWRIDRWSLGAADAPSPVAE